MQTLDATRSYIPTRVMKTLPLRNDFIAPPPDHHDPKDGYYWQVKYIILENGVLYFNHNANVGWNEKLYPDASREK